jgi:hypothetical protein
MNWQQFLPLFIVLVVAVIFVWRSSGSKETDCDGHCGCSHHHHDSEAGKDKPRAESPKISEG